MLLRSPAFKLFFCSWIFVEVFLRSNAEEDQSGFISIDCGLPSNVSYREEKRGLLYDPDSSLIETGESHSISDKYHEDIKLKQHRSLRSFPEGNRNCYKIDITRNKTYLVRAIFAYGNYDGKDSPPEFDLHLGPNHWDNVMFEDSSSFVFKEIIHVPLRDYIHICLVKKDSGVPFISAIDLRPLDGVPYQTQFGPLALYRRYDIGSSSTGVVSRYPDDVHDRFWRGYPGDKYWRQLNTTLIIDTNNNGFHPPSKVLRTAVMPKDSSDSLDLDIFWSTTGVETKQYNVYLHFAEVEKLKANQTREFVLSYNDDPTVTTRSFSLTYLESLTIYNNRSTDPGTHYSSISKTNSSTFPPIISAIEIYVVKELFQAETHEQDVEAMMNIKSAFGVKRNWQGDPCLPAEYVWEGVKCSYDGNQEPRIISLDLSSSGLTGEISPSIFNLSIIEYLDLSGNNITGRVPEFLAQLPKLKSLNLEKNNLKGSVPAELEQKSKDGLLSLKICGNQDLSSSSSCKLEKKKKSAVILIVASVIGGTFILLLSAAAIWFGLTRKKRSLHRVGESTQAKHAIHREYVSTFDQHESLESRKKEFTYSEIRRITNNFETVLGKGGFGTVYYGYLEEYHIPVAVKMLSPSSYQGSTEFFTEVKLLTRVHHRNLTKLLGYCNDEKCIDDNCNAERCNHIKNTKGLIYEYMAKKDLQLYLSGSSSIILKWEERLRIAVGAAQGLEYLHHGCKPRIIHRDLKCTNIMLNENFEAKLSDFGISKTFPFTDDRSHLSTVAAGTPGYIDPEYCRSNRLDEKTDVYSFGVVLLEIITGRPAILKSVERNITIIQWVKSMLDRGIIESVVDQRLQGNFNTNSAWKFVEVAMNCVSQNPIKRPTMSEVVGELKESLEIEVVRTKVSFNIAAENKVEVMPFKFYSRELSIPTAR